MARTRTGRVISRIPSERMRYVLLWQAYYVLALAHALIAAREHPTLVRRVFRTQVRRPIELRRKLHVLWWFVQLLGRRHFMLATARPGEALVVDDGLLHRSVALHASHLDDPEPDAVASYVDLLPPSDLVVFTLAGCDVCEQRVHERGVWKHSRTLGTLDIERYLHNAEWAADVAVRRARERGWTIVAIDNGGRPLDRVERDLARALAHCITRAEPDRVERQA